MPKDAPTTVDRKLFTQIMVLKDLYLTDDKWVAKFVIPLKTMTEQ